MTPVHFALLAALSFALMEPLTAAIHRWIMHGVGSWLHRSHHRRTAGSSWELNDWYPVTFAAIVMLGLWIGFHSDSLRSLVPIGVGITVYGAAYAVVHDGYIHRRVDLFGERRHRALDHLAEAHRIHHRYNRAPFGMLVPMVPSDLRQRAGRSTRDTIRPIPEQPREILGGLPEGRC